MIIGLGFFPTALAYLLYTEGLNRMEAGRASITAMIEPVTAAAIGVAYFGDELNVLKIAGILLILFSVSALYIKTGSDEDQAKQDRLRI